MSMEFKIEQNAGRISEFRADGHVYKLVQEEIRAFNVDKFYLAVETRENKLFYLHLSEDSRYCRGRLLNEFPENGIKAMETLRDCPYFVNVTIRLHRSGHLLLFSGRERIGMAALAMEYCGTNLYQLIQCSKSEATGFRLSQYYFHQLVLALEALQEKKIIHRDLKPSNIYIGGGEHQEGKHLKVGGFRNCAFGDEAKGVVGTRVGARGYMAPEITFSPDRKYNNKVDIFSAGVTFFKMLCGYDPFLGQFGKTDISDKREFWKRNLRLFGILVRRGVMQLIVKGTADELYSATKDISYPIILVHKEEQKIDRVVCYSFAELKESVNGKSNKAHALKFAVFRLVAMDLIDGMLETDPERRWSIDRIKSHEFFIQTPDFPAEEIRKALRLVYVEEKRMPFFRAAASGDLNSLQFMTKGFLDLDGLDLLHDMEDPKGSGTTLLHVAARSGKLNVVRYLMEELGFEAKDESGWTPLIWGSIGGHLNIVKYLVDKKANIEAKNENGWTPLLGGSSKGHLEIVKYLVDMKANIEAKDNKGNTPLIAGSISGHLNIVKYQVDMEADFEAKDNNGKTPYDLTSDNELKSFIKHCCIERRIQVFNRDAKDMHMLSTELKRALGAEVVAIDSKQQKRSP